MIKFILIFITIVIIVLMIKNKVVINIKSFFQKGFTLISEKFGCYCATGKQRLSARRFS